MESREQGCLHGFDITADRDYRSNIYKDSCFWVPNPSAEGGVPSSRGSDDGFRSRCGSPGHPSRPRHRLASTGERNLADYFPNLADERPLTMPSRQSTLASSSPQPRSTKASADPPVWLAEADPTPAAQMNREGHLRGYVTSAARHGAQDSSGVPVPLPGL